MNTIEESIRVFARTSTVYGGGQLLAFSGIDGNTDFNCDLVARTCFDFVGLDIKLPDSCTIRFYDSFPDDTKIAGDFFEFVKGHRVRGVFINAHHLLIEGEVEIASIGPKLASLKEGNRLLVGCALHFDKSLLTIDIDEAICNRSHWVRNITEPASSVYDKQAFYKACSQLKTMVYSPEAPLLCRYTTPDRWPHKGMWLWDSVFHAIGLRHIDPKLAQEAIEALYFCQQPDGFIPIRIDPKPGYKIPPYTQPPLIGMGVALVNEIHSDIEWVERLYPKTAAHINWFFYNRDKDGAGLCEWAIEQKILCRSGESGMDNSPRFDDALLLDACDLNAFLAQECFYLAQFADMIGKSQEALMWKQHHDRLCSLINEKLWDDTSGLYMDYDPALQKRTGVMSSAGFFPLLCSAPSNEKAIRLAAHLRNPNTFGSPFLVPSISASQPQYYAKDMWRGPVWINVNWLIIHGLKRQGLYEDAKVLAQKTMKEIEKWYNIYGAMFEYFDDRGEEPPPKLNRKGECAPQINPLRQVIHDFGWTAALYVDLCYTT